MPDTSGTPEELATTEERAARTRRALEDLLDATKKSNDGFETFASVLRGSSVALKKVAEGATTASGKVLTVAASITVAVKAASDLVLKSRDLVSKFSSLQVAMEAVGKTAFISPHAVSQMNQLRGIIGTTREEFNSLLPTLAKLSKTGFSIGDIEGPARNIVRLYGTGSEAQNALQEYADLAQSLPSIVQDLKISTNPDRRSAALFALAESGKADVAIKAGLIGGPLQQSSEAAKMVTEAQKSRVIEENINKQLSEIAKNFAAFLPIVTNISKYAELGADAVIMMGGFFAANKAISGLGGASTSLGTLSGMKELLRGLPSAAARNIKIPSLEGLKELGSSANNWKALNAEVIQTAAVFALLTASVAVVTEALETRSAIETAKKNEMARATAVKGGQKIAFSGMAEEAGMPASELYKGLAGFKEAQKASLGLDKKQLQIKRDAFDLSARATQDEIDMLMYKDKKEGLSADDTSRLAQLSSLVLSKREAVRGVESNFSPEQKTTEQEQKDYKQKRKTMQLDKKLIAEKQRDAENERKSMLAVTVAQQRQKLIMDSGIYKIYDLGASSAKTGMDLETAFGSSTGFYEKTGALVQASGQRMSTVLGDTAKNLKTLTDTTDIDPDLLRDQLVAMTKNIRDEQIKYKDMTDQLINSIGKTPDIIREQLRAKLASASLDLATAFGGSLSQAQLGDVFAAKTEAISGAMEAAGKDVKVFGDILMASAKYAEENKKAQDAVAAAENAAAVAQQRVADERVKRNKALQTGAGDDEELKRLETAAEKARANVQEKIAAQAKIEKPKLDNQALRGAVAWVESVTTAFANANAALKQVMETKSIDAMTASAQESLAKATVDAVASVGASQDAIGNYYSSVTSSVSENVKNLRFRIGEYKKAQEAFSASIGNTLSQLGSKGKGLTVANFMELAGNAIIEKNFAPDQWEKEKKNFESTLTSVVGKGGLLRDTPELRKALEESMALGQYQLQTELQNQFKVLLDMQRIIPTIETIAGQQKTRFQNVFETAVEGAIAMPPGTVENIMKAAGAETEAAIESMWQKYGVQIKELTQQQEGESPARIAEIETQKQALLEQTRTQSTIKQNELEKLRLQYVKEQYKLQMAVLEAQKSQIAAQLDAAEYLGASFSTILDLQTKNVQVMKGELDYQQRVLEDTVKNWGANSLAAEQQRSVVMQKQTELVKASYAVQRSAVEKLLGAAIGEMGKMGVFNRGTKAQLYGTGYTELPSGLISRGGAQSLEQRQGALQTGVVFGGAGAPMGLGAAKAPMGVPTGTAGAQTMQPFSQNQQQRTATDQVTSMNNVAQNTSEATNELRDIKAKLSDLIDAVNASAVMASQVYASEGAQTRMSLSG